MTKVKVNNKITRLFNKHLKMLEKDINKVLVEADMWYGNPNNKELLVNKRNKNDRNGDQFLYDGVMMNREADHWLHTREELGLK